MTDKEQIIIDGVDVRKCVYRQWNNSQKKHLCYDCDTPFTSWGWCENNSNCYYKQLKHKEREYEELKEKYEELKEANQHIDVNRQCKASKLKRIEELIFACNTGYTDEFTQMIYNIIQEPELAVNNYSIIARYRKALDEIEKVCIEDTRIFTDGTEVRYDSLDKILDIINKAKEEE
ncbi:hypothetical protein [uncultured Megamonas sp.]|uniref:hypothetical protein n=1 Tax=uncultured Megamonas sp. TaxID=286140 RepID=UPI00259B4833|nr:hypothetical protein [uncultured Megamonas sp.]